MEHYDAVRCRNG